MPYRPLPDLPPPAEADPDTAAMAASEAAIARGERHLRILARLTDIAMTLDEALGRKAEAQIQATATPADGATAPGQDAAGAFDRMAQTVRRTIALEARLAAGVKAGRESLIAESAARRATRGEAHRAAKTEAILDGLHDAYAASTPEADYEERVDTLMEDAREHLLDADDLRDWLDRPVGETVARLCAALGLDPDACALEDGAWRIRRPPTEFERHLPACLPQLDGEDGAERGDKTGGEWRRCNDPP